MPSLARVQTRRLIDELQRRQAFSPIDELTSTFNPTPFGASATLGALAQGQAPPPPAQPPVGSATRPLDVSLGGSTPAPAPAPTPGAAPAPAGDDRIAQLNAALARGLTPEQAIAEVDGTAPPPAQAAAPVAAPSRPELMPTAETYAGRVGQPPLSMPSLQPPPPGPLAAPSQPMGRTVLRPQNLAEAGRMIQDTAPARGQGADFGRELWEQVNPVEMVKGIGQMVRHPVDTASALWEAQKATGGRAAEHFRQGDYGMAAVEGLNTALPMVGPVLSDLQGRVASGELSPAGSLGAAVGLAASPPPLRAGKTLGQLGKAGKVATAIDLRRVPVLARPAAVVEAVKTAGGLSINPLTGLKPTEGAMVGKYANTSGKVMAVPIADFSEAHVKQFYDANAQDLKNPKNYAGFWHDTDTGMVNLEISINAPDVRKATKVGELQKAPGTTRTATGEWPTLEDPGTAQKYIFDVEAEKPLPIRNVSDFIASPEFQARMDKMYTAGKPIMANRPEWWSLLEGPLRRVYEKNLERMAGFIASASPQADPIANLRMATEYMRRWIKGEPVVQPDFRVPEGSIRKAGKQLGSEKTRAPNLERVAAGDYLNLSSDKVNDMFSALMGFDVGVYDRHWAKLAEAPERGIFSGVEANKLEGNVGTGPTRAAEYSGKPRSTKGLAYQGPSVYASVENAVRDAAKKAGVPLKDYSATVWEGIRDTIRKEGELFGQKHDPKRIPKTEGGFGDIFERLIGQKAKKMGITPAQLELRLKNGDAQLLSTLLATPLGAYLWYRSQEQQSQPSGRGPV